MSYSDVKIVKSCSKISETSKPDENDQTCQDFPVADRENFLENVDENILFVDDSIGIHRKLQSKLASKEKKEDKTDKSFVNFAQEPPRLPTKFLNCSSPKLSDQISLPINDIHSLFFDEVFMVSELKSSNEPEKLCKEIKDLLNSVKSTETSQEIPEETLNLIPTPFEINETGSVCLMAEPLEDGKILVFSTLQLLDKETNISQDVLSVVDDNLKLVHEKMIEKRNAAGKVEEKSLHILRNDDNFRLIKTKTTNGQMEVFKSDIKWTQSGDFLSYGSNILLMRWLSICSFQGRIESWYCDIEAEFFLSKHIFHRPENTEIYGKTFLVQQVDRVTLSEKSSWKTSSFYICGNLIKEISTNHTSVIHLNPFSDLPPEKSIKNLHENWENDLQLMSMYLDFKARRKQDLQQFTRVSRNILRDYVASILETHPDFVVDFTVDFLRKLERANDREVFRTAARRRHQQN